MKMTRGDRIFGTMMLFGLVVASLAGSWEYAGPATLVALIVGGHAGEAWHQWRSRTGG